MLQIINISDFGSVNENFYIAPQEKSNGVISGERGGHGMGPLRPIHLSGNILFKN